MFQGGPLHELYFIVIDNRGQVIIGPNKKNSSHICGQRARSVGLIHRDMNAENGVLLQLIP